MRCLHSHDQLPVVLLLCVWHDSFIWVTWLVCICDMMHSCVCHKQLLIHMCGMTHLDVWLDSFTYVTWLIHMCDMTHSHVWHDSSICVTWLIHDSEMTHLNERRDSFIYVPWLMWSSYILRLQMDAFKQVMSPVGMSHVTHVCLEWVMSHTDCRWMHLNKSCHQ